MGSVVVAPELSCPAGCGILVPWPRIEPVSPALEGGLLKPGRWGKSPYQFLSHLLFIQIKSYINPHVNRLPKKKKKKVNKAASFERRQSGRVETQAPLQHLWEFTGQFRTHVFQWLPLPRPTPPTHTFASKRPKRHRQVHTSGWSPTWEIWVSCLCPQVLSTTLFYSVELISFVFQEETY